MCVWGGGEEKGKCIMGEETDRETDKEGETDKQRRKHGEGDRETLIEWQGRH